ncbi:YbaK/EbsC family protein [Dethiosulfatarculus sandiegensis]|uniref:Membrane protein n=1 Tax=Dethiosulfatarculus sandiegensis TaxID=1429043 RepID=A0A0D2JGE2_9BACT|nr:YbaK/EbsC family protein [Dethiosulfatarculus sandiegensis]KIX14806.1 membrane protein [Dethiosulfatarculus sandiegensis]
MSDINHPSIQKVSQALKNLELEVQIQIMPSSTRTSQDAAQAVHCEVGQIAKSLIFKAKQSQQPVLVIASGANMVDLKKVSALLGEKLGKADADFVKQKTGFTIGGIPPVGHLEPVTTFIDQDLLEYDYIWAAAGTPNAVFKLNSSELPRITQGKISEVRLEK